MATLTIQPPGDGTTKKDTLVYAPNPTTNYGTLGNMQIGYDNVGIAHSMIQFDLTGIPVGAIISSVVLTLVLSTVNTADTLQVFRILSGNSGWTEAGATWNTKDGTNAWAGSAGCSTSGTDYSSTLMGSYAVTVAASIDINLNNLTEFASMQSANYGLFIRTSNETAVTQMLFWSADNGTPSNRPKLVITYTLGGVAGYKSLLGVGQA